jgi:hypothetical protein
MNWRMGKTICVVTGEYMIKIYIPMSYEQVLSWPYRKAR